MRENFTHRHIYARTFQTRTHACIIQHVRKSRRCKRAHSSSAGPRLTYDQPTINNHNKRPACVRSCGDTCARSSLPPSLPLAGFSSSRRDNFNLNKWLGGRHLCPRLVLFILDYSERTCAAVSSAGRVRCLLSRVNVFQNPPGIYLVIQPDRRAHRPRPAWPFSRTVSSTDSPSSRRDRSLFLRWFMRSRLETPSHHRAQVDS